jgi:hypothetical protein
VALGAVETRALFSADETLPLTIIIDREGIMRGAIAGILLAEEFNQQVKPLLTQPKLEGDVNHVQKSN